MGRERQERGVVQEEPCLCGHAGDGVWWWRRYVFTTQACGECDCEAPDEVVINPSERQIDRTEALDRSSDQTVLYPGVRACSCRKVLASGKEEGGCGCVIAIHG